MTHDVSGSVADDLSDLITADAAKAPPPDKLQAVKDKARELRDLTIVVDELNARAAETQAKITAIQSRELPDLMSEIGIDSLGLEPEGNLPAYDVRCNAYYSANIKADAPTALAAYAWLEREGHGDLIKHSFTINFGRGETEAAQDFEVLLNTNRIDYGSRLGVHPQTLTAFVKNQVEVHHTTPPLDLLGATIGRWVSIKPRKF